MHNVNIATVKIRVFFYRSHFSLLLCIADFDFSRCVCSCRSVLDLFKGNVATPYPGADQVGYELFGLKAYINGDWKVLWMPEPMGKGDWELFNIKEDPAELQDLSNENPQKLKKLVGQWERYKEENGVLDTPLDQSAKVE